MKKGFGIIEAVFDIGYLSLAFVIGIILCNRGSFMTGVTALVLAGGDSFHLIPRIITICRDNKETMRPYLGRGKQITSLTMTIFYLLLWHIGLTYFGHSALTYLMYALAAVRIGLCFMPQNKWTDVSPPVYWGIIRNIPFALMGAVTIIQFYISKSLLLSMDNMWIAVLISFLCYLPVVIWADKKPALGSLMLPKTCAYVWMLIMCLQLPIPTA